MKQKIVIITSKYLHPFVEKAFEDFKEDCTVTIADYTNFDHITDIYRKYEKTADGFIFTMPWSSFFLSGETWIRQDVFSTLCFQS